MRPTDMPTAHVTPAPYVAPLEDTITITVPRKTAEALRAALSFVGGPNGPGEPRTRLDMVSWALIEAGVADPLHRGSYVVTSSTGIGRYPGHPIGIRIARREPGAVPFNPPAAQTGGVIQTSDCAPEAISRQALRHSLERGGVLPRAQGVVLGATLGQAGQSAAGKAGEWAKNTTSPAEQTRAKDAEVRKAKTNASGLLSPREQDEIRAGLRLLEALDEVMFPIHPFDPFPIDPSPFRRP